MSDIAIKVEGLGKRYRLGEIERYRTLRDAIANAATAPARWLKRAADRGAGDVATDARRDTIWALNDVSFDVRRGEVLGVIGRNGAGKSTLLKILSRITEPTTGRAEIFGRVGSLLEVGTGFHNELTGRENIFLNGAILGMSRREIASKFDQIVDFSGVSRFIDTPVKRYSSGMYVRLAFAVAAHLEPEILIVDEVLAVGDAEFQERCLGKMNDVARSGRTVLFVSHNMTAVHGLCDRAVLVDNGSITATGSPSEVVGQYLHTVGSGAGQTVDLAEHVGRSSSSAPLMRSVVVTRADAEGVGSIPMGADLEVRVTVKPTETLTRPVLGVVVKDIYGAPLFGVNNRFIPGYTLAPVNSPSVICCRVPNLPLMPGRYLIDLYLGDRQKNIDVVRDAIAFDVAAADVYGSGSLPPESAGPVYWSASWTVEPTPDDES